MPRWIQWLLDLSLLTFPQSRRERFGYEMRDTFMRALRSDTEIGSATAWVALRMLRDVAVSGIRERLTRPSISAFRSPFGGSWKSDVTSLVHATRRQPGSHGVIIGILALGIGVTTAVFSILDSTILKPLPYQDLERLVAVWPHDIDDPLDRQNESWANFVDLRDRVKGIASLGAVRGARYTLTGRGDPRIIHGALVTPNLLSAFDAAPVAGRLLTEQDDLNTDTRPVLLSHGLWQRALGGDESVIGSSITLDGVDHQVVGVLSPDFRMPRQLASNVPVDFVTTARWYGETNRRGWRRFNLYGLLAADVTRASAESEMNTLYNDLAEEYPQANQSHTARLVSLTEAVLGDDTDMAWITAAAGVLLLIVSVANAAGLLLARGFFRSQELTVRAALGATRGRLTRQLLTESAVLSLVAGVVGTVLAYLLLPVLVSLLPGGLPRLSEVAIDNRVLAFAILLSMAVGLLAGLAPITRLGDIASGLRTTRGTQNHGRLFKAIVIAELSVAVVLLTGGGLLTASFVRLAGVDSGLGAYGSFAFSVSLSRDTHGDDCLQPDFESIYERLRAVPGVEQVGATWLLPLVGGSSQDSYRYIKDGVPAEASAEFGIVAPGYYAAVGRPLVSGRPFDANDRAGSEQVAIVSESFARTVWPGEDPLGQLISHGTGPWRTVVGVVGDVKHYGLAASSAVEYHVPQAQESWPSSMTVVVRTTGDPLEMVDQLRSAVWEVDDAVALETFRTIERIVSDSISVPRSRALLLGAFAVTGLLLAVAGVFAIASFMASTRTREVGIRVALGSTGRAVVGLFIRDTLRMLVLGLFVGLAAAALLVQYLREFLFNTAPLDPLVFGGALAVLTAATVFGALRPALQAAGVDPVKVLKAE